MASEALFQELAKALGQPSHAFRAANAALGLPGQAIQGYEQGQEAKNAATEAKLKPFEIYSKISDSAGPDVANKIFQAQGIPIPDMGTNGGADYSKFGQRKASIDKERLDISNSQPFSTDVAPYIAKGDTKGLASYYQSKGQPVPAREMSAAISAIRPTLMEGTKQFIGNDDQGNPLFSDKFGNITRGSVPGVPNTPKPVSPGGPVLPKTSTMPTSTTRGSSEFASALLPHIQDMRNLVAQADQAGYIGPTAGRVYGQYLAGKVGSTGDPKADALLGQLRTTDSLIKSGMLRTHFGARGGQEMYNNFSNLLNSGKQSAPMINGSLNSMEGFLKGYAEAGNTGQIKTPPNGGASANESGYDPLGLLGSNQ